MSSQTHQPAFSEKLKETFNKIQPGLAAYQARLDRLSQDIRSTEQALKGVDFNIPIRLSIKSWTELADDVINDVEMGINGTELHFEERLTWDNPEGKGFRLYWELYRQEGYVETDGIMLIARGTKGHPELSERKLLIDCKAAKRLEVEPKLQDFLIEVGKVIDPAIKQEEEERQGKANTEALRAMEELSRTWATDRRASTHKKDIEKARAAGPGTEGSASSLHVVPGGADGNA